MSMRGHTLEQFALEHFSMLSAVAYILAGRCKQFLDLLQKAIQRVKSH